MKNWLLSIILALATSSVAQKIQLNVLSGNQVDSAAKAYLLPNPVVTGVTMQVNWADFDNGLGTYNFTSIDAAIQPWITAKKKVNLVVWEVADNATTKCTNYGASNTGNCSVPANIWTKIGPSQYVNCTNQYGTQRIQNYYNPVVQQNYQKAVAALFLHYQSNSSIGYIRPGLGHGGESQPGSGWNDMTMPCGQAFSGAWKVNESSWETYLKMMLSNFALNKGHIQLMTGIVPMYGNQVPDYLASVAAPLSIGFGSQGWEKSDAVCSKATADWCNLFAKYPNVPHELQTLLQTCGDNSCTTGSLTVLLPIAVKGGATILEIYESDWLTAFDPSSSGYKQYGAAYATALKAVNGVSGVK